MALSSILLVGESAIDKELDQLFTAKPPPPTPIPLPEPPKDSGKKRKATHETPKPSENLKRPKRTPSDPDHASRSDKDSLPVKGGKNVRKRKEKGINAPSEKVVDEKRIQDERQDDSDDNENDTPLMHESLTNTGKRAYRTNSNGTKTKYVPPDETPLLRDQRTIFVGNLSVEVAQKRPLLKQLQRHILSTIPSAKIESTRFRSVPFQAPTSKIPGDTPKEVEKSQSARPHDLDRTSAWRSSHNGKDDEQGEASKNDSKKQYLTPGQKKKIAFINHEFHSTADTVNAYIVFAHPIPAENRPTNLPPPPDVMDPYEAAKRATRACDGSVLLDRVIRVDLVGKAILSPSGVKRKGKERQDIDKDGDLEHLDFAAVGTDPKTSIFVGNLDFASKEEDLRTYFETVIRGERGEPLVEERVTKESPAKKLNSWVSRVRIVRDKDTQLGKGFAYVQFVDRECVDEVLAFEPGKLKFAKRKLRVQRCRTLPGTAVASNTRSLTASKDKREDKKEKSKGQATNSLAQPVKIPKGDPSLGEKLAHLPKEERKRYKSADRDRVARRLAKKKARMAMAGGAGVKIVGKEKPRDRVRKGSADKKKGTVQGTVKKKRVRSEKSLTKRNGKKAGGGD